MVKSYCETSPIIYDTENLPVGCVCVSILRIKIFLGRHDCIINKIQNNIKMYNKFKKKLKKKNMYMDLGKRSKGWAEFSKM